MKIRVGFVTNSSSSSYLVIHKLENVTKESLAEDFGKVGSAMITKYVKDKDQTILEILEDSDAVCDYCEVTTGCRGCDAKLIITDEVIDDFRQKYCNLDDDGVYLWGWKRQGWGGDYDVSDSSAVKLAELLGAKRIYEGDSY